MLDVDPSDAASDSVELLAAGAEAQGEYRCSACGYGVAVYRVLPDCPMCAGSTWERGGAGALARTDGTTLSL